MCYGCRKDHPHIWYITFVRQARVKKTVAKFGIYFACKYIFNCINKQTKILFHCNKVAILLTLLYNLIVYGTDGRVNS